MTDKMPEEWEKEFLDRLYGLQESNKAYWVQTKHIAHAMFGHTLSQLEFRTHKTRVYRLAQRLIKKGRITTTARRENVGKSTGKSLIKYYHTEKSDSVYENMKRIGGRK